MPSFTVFKGTKNDGIQEIKTEKPALKGDQVLLKVTASGLCGTDMHYKNGDMALGHEGVVLVAPSYPLAPSEVFDIGTKFLNDADALERQRRIGEQLSLLPLELTFLTPSAYEGKGVAL